MSGTPLPLLKWEYARLESTADGVNVVFTHHEFVDRHPRRRLLRHLAHAG